MLQSYLDGSHEECFEALTIFKSVFGHLIDPNILSIQANLTGIEINRNGIEYRGNRCNNDFLFSQIESVNQLLGEQDQKILDAYESVYSGRENVFNQLLHKTRQFIQKFYTGL